MSKFKTQKSKFDELREKLKAKKDKQESGQNSYDDSWKFRPQLPKGSTKVNYVVRFLPHIHVDEGLGEPWVEGYVHIFSRQDGKRVYTVCPKREKNSKEPCPICDKARNIYDLVNQGAASSADEEEARMYYKKQRFWINVLIVKDPRTGEESQEGKVLVYECGPQIFEKLNDSIMDQELNFWDNEEGHDFNLILRTKSEYVTYESSHFSMKPSVLADGDEAEQKRIMDQIHNLNEKIFGNNVRTVEELEALMTGKKKEDTPKNSTTRDSEEDGGAAKEDTKHGDENFDDVIDDENDTTSDKDEFGDKEDGDEDDDISLDDDELFE